jgi:hypothetical protein
MEPRLQVFSTVRSLQGPQFNPNSFDSNPSPFGNSVFGDRDFYVQGNVGLNGKFIK